jgi:hypothetical protein
LNEFRKVENFVMVNPKNTDKLKYEKPTLTPIDLLDESALGDTGFGEPPPPDAASIPSGGEAPLGPESDTKWKSRQW